MIWNFMGAVFRLIEERGCYVSEAQWLDPVWMVMTVKLRYSWRKS